MGCGLGWTVKTNRVWADYEKLLKPFFLRYYRQKFNLKSFKKYSRVRIKKLYRIKVNKSQKKKN